MTVTAVWDRELSSVAIIYFESPWTWEEYYLMNEHLIEDMLSGKPANSVDMIVSFVNSDILPSGLFTHFQRSARELHSQIRTAVMTGMYGPMQSIFAIIMRLNPNLPYTILYADSVPAAREIIREVRASSGETG